MLQIVRGFLPMFIMMTSQQEASAGGSMDKMPEVPAELLEQLDPDRILNTYGKDVPRLPCALVMCGSGCAVIKVRLQCDNVRRRTRCDM